jgi:Tol biopolymer transport system component
MHLKFAVHRAQAVARFAVALGVLTLAACGGTDTTDEKPAASDSEASQEPPGAPWRAADLVVSDARALDADFGAGVATAVSPDGKRLFVQRLDENRLCIVELNDGSEQCTTYEYPVTSPLWSTDSTRVAFTEDFFVAYAEADIWILAAEDLSISNLTDDGIAPGLGKPDDNLTDLMPTWVDGDLVFLRTTWVGSEEQFLSSATDVSDVRLMKVSPDGGEPIEIGAARTTGGRRLIQPMVVSPDGESLLTVAANLSVADSAQLVRIDLATGEPESIAPLGLRSYPPPRIVDVSANGRLALVHSLYDGTLLLLDLETGSATPVLGGTTKPTGVDTAAAAFSPDGTSIALTVSEGNDASSVWVIDVADVDGTSTLKEITRLLAATDVAGLKPQRGAGFYGFERLGETLAWADDGRLAVPYEYGYVVTAEISPR